MRKSILILLVIFGLLGGCVQVDESGILPLSQFKSLMIADGANLLDVTIQIFDGQSYNGVKEAWSATNEVKGYIVLYIHTQTATQAKSIFKYYKNQIDIEHLMLSDLSNEEELQACISCQIKEIGGDYEESLNTVIGSYEKALRFENMVIVIFAENGNKQKVESISALLGF